MAVRCYIAEGGHSVTKYVSARDKNGTAFTDEELIEICAICAEQGKELCHADGIADDSKIKGLLSKMKGVLSGD